jgi:hypothetical protein
MLDALGSEPRHNKGVITACGCGNVANISERNAASTFRVKVFRAGEFLCICRFMQMEQQILSKPYNMYYKNTFIIS